MIKLLTWLSYCQCKFSADYVKKKKAKLKVTGNLWWSLTLYYFGEVAHFNLIYNFSFANNS